MKIIQGWKLRIYRVIIKIMWWHLKDIKMYIQIIFSKMCKKIKFLKNVKILKIIITLKFKKKDVKI